MPVNNAGTDGKKTGVNNAANKPFRLNGLPPDWAARRVGAHQCGASHIGRHKVIGAIGASVVANLGYFKGFVPSRRMDQLVTASLDSGRCPRATAVFESIAEAA